MQETEEEGVYMDGLDEGIKTIVKSSSEKAVNSVLKFISDKYGKACVATGSAFNLYLKNSELRYNKVKTLADMTEPRTLEGENGIYVDKKGESRTPSPSTKERIKSMFRLSLKK